MCKTILRQPFSACLIVVLVIMIMVLEPARNYAVFADNKSTTATPIPTATPQAAVTTYDQAILIDPQNAEAYLNRGNVLLIEDKISAAIADFKQAIKLKPKYTEAYFSLGVAFYKLGQYDVAIENFTQAIQSNSKYAEAYYYRGLNLYEQGKVDAATDDFTETIKLSSAFVADAYYYRSIIFTNQGKLDLAIKDISQTIIIDPKFSVAYGQRAVLLDEQGKLTEALKDYQMFIKTAGGPVNPAIFDRMIKLETILSDSVPNVALGAIPLEQTFTTSDRSLSVQYPLHWATNSTEPFEVVIGNSGIAVDTLTGNPDAPMSLASGNVAVLVRYISADSVATNWDVSGDPVKFLKSLVLAMPSTNKKGKIEAYRLGTLETARVMVDTKDIETVIYAFFIGKTPVYVVGAAAAGEVPQFQPTIEAMILSLRINDSSRK